MLAAGRMFGPYRLIEVIGRGASGVVFRARRLSSPREVALKILRSNLVRDTDSMLRFQREVGLHRRLEHPNLVTLIDAGRQGAHPYLVLELVEGPTLSFHLEKGGPLPLEEFLGISRGLAAAVSHLHGERVVHRDLKPANVLLTAKGEPKIADLGLSREIDVTQITSDGMLIGSLPYMAPEVLSGESGDMAADTYALGVIFLEMLIGRCPVNLGSLPEMLSQVNGGSVFDARALPLELDDSVVDLLRRMLRSDPGGRPDLLEVRETLLVHGPGPQDSLRTRRLHRRVMRRSGLARFLLPVAGAGMLAFVGLLAPAIPPLPVGPVVAAAPTTPIEARAADDATRHIASHCSEILRLLDRYDLGCERRSAGEDVDAFRTGMLRDEFHRRAVADPSLLFSALSHLTDALEEGLETGTQDPVWLDLERAGGATLEEVARSHGMDTDHRLRPAVDRLASLLEDARPGGLLPQAAVLSLRSTMQYLADLSFESLIRRARVQDQLVQLMEGEPAGWQGTSGRFHRLRLLWARVFFWSLVEQRYPESIPGVRELLRLHCQKVVDLTHGWSSSGHFADPTGGGDASRLVFQVAAGSVLWLAPGDTQLALARDLFLERGTRLDPASLAPRHQRVFVRMAEDAVGRLGSVAPGLVVPWMHDMLRGLRSSRNKLTEVTYRGR